MSEESKVESSELFPPVTLQDLLHVGLNAFAFELAAESFRKRASECGWKGPFRVCASGVEFILQVCPDQPLRVGERKP